MIDIHTHILPNVDDGSKSFEISYELLKREISCGIKDIVLTPHQNQINLNKELINKSFIEFKNKIDLDVNLYLGSEILYYDSLLNDIKSESVQSLNNSDYYLVEFSHSYDNIYDFCYEMKLLNKHVIVAHIERYDYLSLEDLIRIKQTGALIQINAGSIIHNTYKKKFKFMLKNDLIDFVASDCHNLTDRTVDFEKILKFIKKKNINTYNKIINQTIDFLKENKNEK